MELGGDGDVILGSMVEVSVRAMTASEFDTWQHELARVYADRQVVAGIWPSEGALERALADNAELLPQGLGTPGMLPATRMTGLRGGRPASAPRVAGRPGGSGYRVVIG
jgi:hypothetical protein